MYSETALHVSERSEVRLGQERLPTCGLVQGPSILNVEIGECAMDVGAHLLSGLGRPKHADDGDFGLLRGLRKMSIFAQLGVISGWRGLVVVDAVEPDPKHVHFDDVVVVESRRRTTERESKSPFLTYPKRKENDIADDGV
jgi:hypothetical protein